MMCDVGTALGKFKRNHCKDVADAGIKYLEVMMEALCWIELDETKQNGRTRKVKYLSKACDLTRATEKKRKANDLMTSVRVGAVYRLREIVRNFKKARAEEVKRRRLRPSQYCSTRNLKDLSASPLPSP
jgi:hypothetical protein